MESGDTVGKLNEAIAAADSTAFAGYTVMGRGGSLYYIRIEMPTYVTKLEAWAKFEGSSNVKEIYFPTHIVEDAETGKLKEVAYLTTIVNQNIFSSCTKLEVIHNHEFLPAGINNPAGFAGCSSLKYFKLPEGITSIASDLFSGCSSLESVEIPYGVTSIGANAFMNCDSITEITLPNSVVSFAKKSFAYMDNLETINFGAGLTNIYASDHNCENLDGCTKLKYVYLPDTFATTVQNTGNNILQTGTNVTMFFTGNLEQAEALRTKLTASATNNLIKNATFIDYTAPENANIDFKTYAQTQGKTILVYNYNECEAFYNNDHNYQNETNNCLDGVTCTRCDDNVTSFTQHNMKETLVYANGFTAVGVYNKFCTNASNCAYEKAENVEAPAIFKTNETNGFSTKGEDGIAFGGFVLDSEALDEYNRVNGDATIKYGVILINPDYLDGKESFFVNGEVNASKGFIQTDMSNARYANISIAITGFKGNAENLSLILAIYAYTDENDVEFIQSKESVAYSAKVTLGAERLYAVTLASVRDGDKTLADLDEYVMPSKREQE
ncbi:MAG: leucine-rich repeat domain-containing protein [Ruminococcaceae bacterium]|nr:leucine-rich repeat domain-containing protein [Oscillospiraceae bacterium]